MHRRDAAADDRAAEPAGAGDPAAQRGRQAYAGEHDGRKKGEDGQEDVVAGRQPGREGQHGDEVRRPDAEPGCDRRHAQPDMAHDPVRPAHVLEKIDRGERGEGADDRGEDDQAQIVLLDDAGIYGEHCWAFGRLNTNDR